MNARDRVWPYALTAAAAGAAALVLLDMAVPVVLAFVLICPGMALVRLVRLAAPWPELLLAIVVSLCLAAGFAGLSVYLEMWNPRLVLLGLAVVTLGAVLIAELHSPYPAGGSGS